MHNNFLKEAGILERYEEALTRFIFEGKRADIKKLSGKLKGHYRMRIGKVRVIFKMDFDRQSIYVKKADFRGSVYK